MIHHDHDQIHDDDHIHDHRDHAPSRRQFLRALGTIGAGVMGWRAVQALGSVIPAEGRADAAGSPAEPAGGVGVPAASVEVIARRAWGAAPRDVSPPQDVVRRLTVHHSAVALPDNRRAPKRFREHLKLHYGQGRPDIAYHFLIDRNGNVYEGRPVWTRTDSIWGTYDVSGHLLVMCEGNFETQRISSPQLGSLADVLAWGAREYQIDPQTIRGHRDFAKTLCPGRKLNRLVQDGTIARLVEQRVAAGGVRLDPLSLQDSREKIDAIAAGRL